MNVEETAKIRANIDSLSEQEAKDELFKVKVETVYSLEREIRTLKMKMAANEERLDLISMLGNSDWL